MSVNVSNAGTIDWPRIEQFLGYGNSAAPVVFVGIEEGLSSDESLLEDLLLRSTWPSQVMDLQKAHQGIAGAERYADPENAPMQSTWDVMVYLMLRRRGEAFGSAECRRYRALELGRTTGETLLLELLPYPKKSDDSWPYDNISRFKTRDEYRTALMSTRKTLLRELIVSTPRELIVCYGKGKAQNPYWDEYLSLFPGAAWRRFNDDITVGDFFGARVVLCKHFARNFRGGDARNYLWHYCDLNRPISLSSS